MTMTEMGRALGVHRGRKSVIAPGIAGDLAVLAASFPLLPGIAGANPFDADQLAHYWNVCADLPETPERLARCNAISFLLGPALFRATVVHFESDLPYLAEDALSVAKEWDIQIAFSTWDADMRAPFLKWLDSIPCHHLRSANG